ncbi:Knh1p NDAI_0D04500 [Naumovozyma dairenensis CBS 421]|uniref:Uncharacterized protein n=1 Tax=Naumovozyma dairenensis (strain ATCC 10597 / BCRC 20456 / CBS 421 / NBRC 0211 / NRRL Y-12639) TaxID=1071378 RepID=G0WAF3_NAUDC|nr:hypothetical protein NDAI_0D04500 [Naumovozyma dairenensis CBS 421]CCD24764.1 hypothetical protein NDAI_0D04500 [Naumovozyma dairenensis CBS 421]
MQLRLIYILPIFVFLLNLVKADLTIITPEPGEKYDLSETGEVSIDLSWVYLDSTPSKADITSFTFSLCTGPNYKINCLATLAKVSAAEVDSDIYKANILGTLGTDGVYYIQIFAQTESGYTIHYSPKFYLEGMTGVLVAYTIMESADPTPETRITTGAVGATIDSRSFTVPYTKQTGKARYAPMQMQPGTKLTAKSWTRKYATSAVTFYTSMRKSLQQVTTITPGWSYAISSDVNYATHAPFPSDNGGWYDPSKRLSLTTRKINLRKRAV